MDGNQHQLFSDGDLADFLLDRWNSFKAEIALARVDEFHERGPEVLRARLKAKYGLTIPAITDSHIVEHGEVEPDLEPRSWMTRQERIAYLEGLLALPRCTFAVIRLEVEGDVDLLRYRPVSCDSPTPQGQIVNGAIHWRCTRSGSADKQWLDDCEQNIRLIERFLTLSEESIKAFNSALQKKLDNLMPREITRSTVDH